MSKRLAAAIAALVAVMSALAWLRWSVWSYGADTGTFSQSIINTFHGFANAVEPRRTHFGTHWSPIIALLWPLLALTRSPLSIQIAQTVLIGMAAVPLYAFIRAYAGREWAFRCSVLALIYPPLLSNAFSEFHELAFYPVAALALVWAADRGKWGWFAVASAAAVTIREDVCIQLIVLGLLLAAVAWRHRSPQPRGLLYGEPLQPRNCVVAGLTLAALAAGSLAIYRFAVLAKLGPWVPAHFYAYPWQHPLQVAASILTLTRVTFVLEIVLPLALLPLFSRWSLLAVPALAEILLANDGVVWRMGSHYVLLCAPWVLLGASSALVRTAGERSAHAALRWWRAAMTACVVFLIAFDPMHPLHYLRAASSLQIANVGRAMSCVPRDAGVALHDEWLAHYALAYPGATLFRADLGRYSQYVVFARDWQNRDFTGVVLPQIHAAERMGRYREVCRYGDVVVLRREVLMRDNGTVAYPLHGRNFQPAGEGIEMRRVRPP